MEKTRFVKVVRIGSEHYDDTEKIVNQNICTLRDSGAKIISIQALSIPFLMYNIIYEAETEISGNDVPETAEQEETKEKSDNAETAETNTEQESGEQHGTDESEKENT